MTKNVSATAYSMTAVGTGGTYNSWQPTGIPTGNVWAFTGIPYVTDGNSLTTAWAYDSTDSATLAHPALPSPWTSEQAGFYYIDNNTGTGTPTFGDPTAPLDQIPRIIPAGSVVVMAPGSYDVEHSSPDDITFNGTSGSQCWIIAEDPLDPPICRKVWEVNGTHAIIEDIDAASTLPLTDTSAMGIAIDNANNITVRRCNWSGNISQGGWGIGNSSYIYIYDCDIHDVGDLTPASDIDEHGINLDTSDDCWIVGNRIYNCSGDSVQIGGQDNTSPTNTNRIYASGNDCHGNRQTGIWVKEATDVIISENDSHDQNNGLFAEALCFGAQYDHANVWFINNTCRDSKAGIKFQSGTGTQYVIGNQLYDLTGPSGFNVNDSNDAHAITTRGGTTFAINNTMQRCHAGISATGTTTLTCENNLIGDPTIANASEMFFENTTNKTADYNYYFGTPSDIRFNSSTIQTLSDFQTAGFEANAQQSTDPGFTDEPNDDFTLTGSSICLNNGTVSAVYATFLSRYGDSIAEDINGQSRPVGSWDIGAFERAA